jgi:hypothetical protein
MIVSLSFNMVLCFKENLFIVAYIFLIVFEHRGWIAHLLGDKEGKFILLLSTNNYQWHCLSCFAFLLQNLLCATD